MNWRRIFISIVQKELATEREALRDYLNADPLLRRFFDVFLFEDLPASDRRADNVYLDEVAATDIYLGLFADEYGWEDQNGLSPTEREFDAAAEQNKPRLIYVKGADDGTRHPQMQALIRRAGSELIRRRFTDLSSLKPAVYASLVTMPESIAGRPGCRSRDGVYSTSTPRSQLSAARVDTTFRTADTARGVGGTLSQER